MRTLLTFAMLILATTGYGTAVIVASYFGMRLQSGNFMDHAPRRWARALLRAAGCEVALHGVEHTERTEAHIFVSNHVSWFDVLALAAHLPRYRFVAKAELFRFPIFGRGALAVGTIPIQRDNRKAAFASYEQAAQHIKGGDNVVVFPEGTRGTRYALRPFKKGPFVLAIAAQAPIVPTLVHGTIEILPRGSFRVRPGTIHVHFLDPIPTAGLSYEDREALAEQVRGRIADALERLYQVPRAESRAA